MISLRTTAALVALVVIILAVEHRLDRPPLPRGADAPPTEFSELRARALLYAITETVGHHEFGSPGLEEATARVVAELRRIPGVEVEVQDANGTYASAPDVVTVYSVRNVVARLRGESDEAMLLSGHIDAVPPSFGAADDGVGVAAIVEVLRALAAGPKLARSVVVNLNGAEEFGLLGAAGFMQHRWARDVRMFVNVDAAGDAGRAILFRASPGAPWLVDAYARGVPHPFGNVIGQDLFRAGLVPSDTDFHVYRDARLPGVDLALFEDGWAYHTALDRYARVEPGSLQHVGDDVLGLCRALATATPRESPGWPIYYGLFDWHFFHMSNRAAHAAGWLVTLFTIVLVFALGRARLPQVLRRAGWTSLAVVAGTAFPLVVAALVGLVLHRALGWYATPAIACFAYAPLALGAALLVSSLRRADEPLDDALGALLFTTLTLALLVACDVGSAYLVAWWCLAIGASVLVVPRIPVALVALCAVPLCFTMEVVAQLIRLGVPLMGRAGLGPLSEVAIAAALAIPLVVTLAPLLFLLPSRGVLARVALAAGTLGTVVAVIHAPYTHERPQRAHLYDVTTDGVGELEEHDGAHLVRRGDKHATQLLPPPAFTIERGASANGTRAIDLEMSGSPFMRLELPAGVVRGWSLPVPAPPLDRPVLVRMLSHAPEGSTVHVRLDVPPDTTALALLSAVRSARTPALDAVVVPDDVTVDALVKSSVHVPLSAAP